MAQLVQISVPRGLPRLLVLAGIAVALTLATVTTSASAAPIATPPSDCNSSFNPYDYTQTAVSACGYDTFPVVGTEALQGGGTAYVYDVGGGTVRYLVPPAGFDPSTASDAQLTEYGFPSRPSDLADMEQWQAEMNNWTGAAAAPPFLAETHATATVYYDNWAGHSVTDNPGTFTQAGTIYYEPQFYSSACSSNAEVTWDGIGGYYSDSTALAQNGTAHNVPGLGDHQSWWEIYPSNDIIGATLIGTVGWQFNARTTRISGGYNFYFYNYYSGKTNSFDETGGNFDIYDGRSAEAIAERPTIGGSLSNLSNFETLTFTQSHANGIAFNDLPYPHLIDMEDSSGNIMTTTSSLGSNGSFTIKQNHCS